MRYVDVSEDDKRDAIAAVFGAPRATVAGQQAGNEASSFEAFGQQVDNKAADA